MENEEIIRHIMNTPENSNPNVIRDMLRSSGQNSGTGSGLPEVTTDDNGKVLTVVNGEWAAGNLQNGDNTDVPEKYWEADSNINWENNADTYLYKNLIVDNALIAGETYKVTYNGQEYILIAHEDSQGGGIALGEFDYQNNRPSFEDYSFYINSYNDDGELGLYVTIDGTTAPEDFKIEHINGLRKGDVYVYNNGEFEPINLINFVTDSSLLHLISFRRAVDINPPFGIYDGNYVEKPLLISDGDNISVEYLNTTYNCTVYSIERDGATVYYIGDGNSDALTNSSVLDYAYSNSAFQNYPFIIELKEYENKYSPIAATQDKTYDTFAISILKDDTTSKLVIKSEFIENPLPAVNSNDNGKVLTVVDGQWNVAESSNTSRELYWQTTPDIDWQDVSQSSKSVTAQVEVGSGLIPNDTYIITYDGQEYTLTAQELVPGICLLGEIDEDNGGPSFENYPFIISGGANTDNTVVSIGVEDSNPPADFKIEHIIEYQSLPAVTVVNNGKILKVVDGEWAIVDPNGEEKRDVIFEDTVSEYGYNGIAMIEIATYDSGTQPEDVDFLFTSGETYIVTFDGVEYELTAKDLNNVIGGCELGERSSNNGAVIFENYPFFIEDDYQQYDGHLRLYITANDPTTSHDIKIEHVTKIDSICNCLPEVTNTDNGKILQVINGEWVAAYDQEDIANRELFYDASAGSWTSYTQDGATIQNKTISPVSSDTKIIPGETYLVTIDGVEYLVTAGHDDNAYAKDYLGEYDNNHMSVYDTYPFNIGTGWYGGSDQLYINFKGDTPPSEIKIEHIIESQSLPTVDEDDNGKILKVVDGKWTIVDTSTLNCLYENILDKEYSSWSETESGQWHVAFSSSVNHAFVSGEKYLITYDDIQYITTAYGIETKDQYVEACQLGNINNGDPMELKWYDSVYGGGHYEVIIPENTGSHKINIKHIIDADISRKVIYDKTISNWNIQGNRIGYSEFNLEQPLALISGELYIVTIDETEYIVRANAGNQQEYVDIKDILIGDPDVFIISTNRSSYNTSYENGIVIYTNDSSSHYIKIERLILKAKIFAPENDGDMLVGIDGEWTPINMLDIKTESTVLFDYQDGLYDLSINGNYPTYAPDSVDDIEAILGDYVGKTVIVSYDGTDYECPVYSTSGYYMIGNNAEYSINHLEDINPGNFEDYPFLFVAINNDNNWEVNIFSVYDGANDVTIRTIDETTAIVKSEYLPCQYIEDGTGDYAVIINGIDTLPSTGGYDPGTPKNIASGDWAIAEGKATEASGTSSHAEGERTVASGYASHAEGYNTLAVGSNSHAEGTSTKAYGSDSHVEGIGTETGLSTSAAAGFAAHAEGRGTKAIAEASHTEGEGTIANGKYQHVSGKYNIADSGTAANIWNGTYVEIIGNGTSDSNRSNARTLDWSGNEVLAGGLTVGAAGITIGNTTITEAQLTALLAMLS